MGGYQRSSLEFEKRRAARLRLIENVSNLASQLEGLRNEFKDALRNATTASWPRFPRKSPR